MASFLTWTFELLGWGWGSLLLQMKNRFAGRDAELTVETLSWGPLYKTQRDLDVGI